MSQKEKLSIPTINFIILIHRYMTLQDGYDENMTYFAHSTTVAIAVGDVRGEEEEISKV